MSSPGKVYLVGAGPGDPGLITLRGVECLRRADAVVYDALVNPVLLQHAPQAEQIYAGKKSGGHSLPQGDITRILLELAQSGKAVVRLKGGDPFVFGRGGEEALALAEAGIPFELVPGVTSGIAAPAYFGIPVTHRGLATSVSFITAHATGEGGAMAPLALDQLALRGTLVFYMGLTSLGKVCAELLAAGRDPATPAALIASGTSARQRIFRASLGAMATAGPEQGLQSPVLFMVGEVVGLADSLEWFGRGDLAGLRAVVTHAAGTSDPLENLLRDAGADVLHLPLLSFVPAAEPLPALDYGSFDWIVFSSPNAAEQLFAGMRRLGQDARRLGRARFCAIGKRTAHAVEREHLIVDVQPRGFEPGAVIAAMEALAPLRGTRVLVPRADISRSALPEALRAAGAEVVELVAYRTEQAALPAELLRRLESYAPEVIVFTNSNAARAFAATCWEHLGDDIRERLRIAVIGPVTKQAAVAAGLPVEIEPLEHDAQHLFEAICQWHHNGNQKKR